MRQVEVLVKGPGAGRETAIRALQSSRSRNHLDQRRNADSAQRLSSPPNADGSKTAIWSSERLDWPQSISSRATNQLIQLFIQKGDSIVDITASNFLSSTVELMEPLRIKCLENKTGADGSIYGKFRN